MFLRLSLGSVMVFAAFVGPLSAQELAAYTPAPVNVKVAMWDENLAPSSEYSSPTYCLAPTEDDSLWEVLIWSGAEPVRLDGFTLACESGCLNPDAHVDIATQAA